MKLFVKFNSKVVAYEGMTQETIIAMLAEQNLVPEFIEEHIYSVEVDALQKNLELTKLAALKDLVI